ncbi:MAG: Hsp20/alpha crystallin family protein [Deltaproteobacteria bacterium]|nr:Hsp20/alpha crystallin family protein [Deltaproteobacteria bacterium]
MINLRITREMKSFSQDLDSLLDQAFSSPQTCLAYRGQAWTPHTDVYETSSAYHLVAEVPGLAPEDIEVIVDREHLLIAGQRRPGGISGPLRVHQAEIMTGPFKRVFRLPGPIKPDETEARCELGLLTIILPKEAPNRSRVEVR